MKKITVIIVLIVGFSKLANAQELKYSEVKDVVYESILKSFPERFNSSDDLKDMFYQRCNQYPNYCKKLKFKKILDLRIDKVWQIDSDFKDPKSYEIVFSFNFLYYKGKNDFMGSATMKARLNKVLDQYQVVYLKFDKTSGRHSKFKYGDQASLVLLGQ
ncbi:hypothetical protein [Aquimarina algiphila]|uniref:hypothetical protein n=1 Tax=Aquimarina algiphila TaxID=2047982 RepID=UPI00233002D9|nr:hypothetical protein [Aquimarina algiphila]